MCRFRCKIIIGLVQGKTPSQLASAGLCAAKAAAASDPEKARATFYDRSHSALHTVARGLEPVDRALAAQAGRSTSGSRRR